MMAREVLLDSSGNRRKVNEGESSTITVTLIDASGASLAKAALTTLTVSLYNGANSETINSRDGQSVLDANDGTVSEAGVLTLKLGPLDNVIIGAALDEPETHFLDLKWTWTDKDGDPQTGIHEFQYDVMPAGTPTDTPTSASVGWLG